MIQTYGALHIQQEDQKGIRETRRWREGVITVTWDSQFS